MLVTGGAGFIGSHFVRSTVIEDRRRGVERRLTVLDRLTYAGNLANLAPVADAVDVVRGDICDRGLLRRVVPGHDVVVNFAAESHVDRSIEDADAFVRTNVLGVQTLLDACLAAGVRTFVQISTDEVYGSTATGSWAEDAPLAPSSPYSATKAGGDLLALAFHRTHELDVRIVRCGNNYGPYQYPEKIVPLFVTNLLRGRPVPLYGDGRHVRSWLHVDDHCRGIRVVLAKGSAGEIYHIAGTDELTNRELTDRLLAECGAGRELVRSVPDRKGHDRRYSLDDSKLRGLGYAPATPFATGLAEVVRWYAAHRDWWEPLVG